MLSEAIIRSARLEDSEAIAPLMREIASEPMRRFTILRSPYLARFIADELTGNKHDEYVICTVHERIVGMCSWRHGDTTLHLNYLSVVPDMRGQGLGTVLMLDGLRRILRTPQDVLSVDVWSDTPRARAWYRSLHLRLEERTQWIQRPLPLPKPGGGLHCVISGLDEAAANHLRYGFSQVALTTNSASYQVGRLGADLFRVGTFAILQDPAALQGLACFDAERQLVCFGSTEDYAELSPGTHALVAESERLVSPCATVLKNLESSRSRRHIL
jgi:ribosomal protein S18 acetylase RimI-like enzyme